MGQTSSLRRFEAACDALTRRLRPHGPKSLLRGAFILVLAAMLYTSSVEGTEEQSLAAGWQPSVETLQVSPARVVETSRYSTRLSRDMPLLVYLPPGYDSHPDARYPVLYMLHGLGGSHRDWQNWGLFDAATRLIELGEIPPMIIVTPEGGSGYWMDHYGGGPRYGSYITKGVVPYIDANFRTLAYGFFRGVGGMSMGGHGALQLSLNNPGMFSIVGAHSVALRTKQQAFEFFGDQAYFENHDPVSIVAKRKQTAAGLLLWIDIGRSDGWLPAAANFHEVLQAKGVPHKWQVWDGGHDGAYCSSHVGDYLRFYGGAFAAHLDTTNR